MSHTVPVIIHKLAADGAAYAAIVMPLWLPYRPKCPDCLRRSCQCLDHANRPTGPGEPAITKARVA